MQDKIQASRSCFQKRNSYYIIPVLSVVVFMYWFFEINPFKSIPDRCFPFMILACIFNVLFCAECFSSLMVLWEEAEETNLPLLTSRIFDYLNYKICFFISFPLVIAAVYLCGETHYVLVGLHLIVLDMIFALLFVCIYNVAFDYDAADILISQNSDKSIGAMWAVGAYKNYYEPTLKDMVKKIRAFESENGVQIPIKKLIIICPLSCNVEGSLERDGIFLKGQLKVLELDQGGNANRQYKNSVYGINKPRDEATYVVAEYSSPLGALYERRSMDKTKWNYHRDCFIQSLKDLLQNLPCVVLEYDDENPYKTENLHKFLLSFVEQHLRDRNLLM